MRPAIFHFHVEIYAAVKLWLPPTVNEYKNSNGKYRSGIQAEFTNPAPLRQLS
jgi:hypothetical protein